MDATPERDASWRISACLCVPPRSHPRRGPCSALRHAARIARSLERVEVLLGCARVRRLCCYGPVERGAGAPLAGMRPCNRPIACRHRPYACLRGQIPRGAPLFSRCDTPCWGFSRIRGARARRRSRPVDATRSRSHCTPLMCARWDTYAVTSPDGPLFRAPASLAVIRAWRNARRGT